MIKYPPYSIRNWDGLNWYSYVSNNPLNKVDPTGLFEIYSYVDNYEVRYEIGTKPDSVHLINTMSDTLGSFIPFFGAAGSSSIRAGLNTVEQALGGFKRRTIFDSAREDYSIDTLFSDVAGTIGKDRARSLMLPGLSAFETVTNSIDNRKTDRRIDKIMSNIQTGMFKNVSSPEEAIELGQKFADGVNTYFDLDLEKNGVPIEDWASSLVDISNGKSNDLYDQVCGEE